MKRHENEQKLANNLKASENVNDSDAQANDNKFPTYPHYSVNEDIMNPDNHTGKIDIEHVIENGKFIGSETKNTNATQASSNEEYSKKSTEEDDELEIVPGTEADVTKEDLVILNAMDGDLRKLDQMTESGDDLDIPGAELDDVNESIGEEDEENNYYSLGGDRHENLEEDRS